jgi:hypothetical protein
MQMNGEESVTVPIWKVLCAFFIASLISSTVFAWCVTSVKLQNVWFHTAEFWVLPTRKLWMLTAGLFILSLAGGYLVAHFQKWLRFSIYRLVAGGALIVLFLGLALSIQPLAAFSVLLLFRFAIAAVLSTALLVITGKWQWLIVSLMIAASLATPLLASIPYAFFRSMSPEWFEVSEFFFGSSLLAILFGWWLLKSRRAFQGLSSMTV